MNFIIVPDVTYSRRIRALVMDDGVPCYGALEIVGLLLLLRFRLNFSHCHSSYPFFPVFSLQVNVSSEVTANRFQCTSVSFSDSTRTRLQQI